MTSPRQEWALDTRRLGRRVLVYDRLDSTNNLAAALAEDPTNDGVVVLADEQTAGRGQYGRTWLAPPGASVLMSVLLFPPLPLRRPAILTAWAAVAVCNVVRLVTGVQAKIKWPNDVLLRGRKVCGILIEQRRGTVAGIGLNVRQTAEDLVRAGLTEATSLAQHAPAPPESAEVARVLIRQLDEDYDLLCGGDLGTLEACWKWHLGLLGRQVRARCLDGTEQGRLMELGFDGARLRRPDGTAVVLAPEAVLNMDEVSGA
jgi:BirA family transcriptional regulator, biotin operon repressor / biotin---[acetyl-CoA-carboxylase] ligase